MEVGVPPLECSLVGEIDLARSEVQSAKALPNQHIAIDEGRFTDQPDVLVSLFDLARFLLPAS